MHHHHHPYDPAIAARKEKNRQIFKETLSICRRGGYVSPSGATVTLPPMDEVLAASVFYVDPPNVEGHPKAQSSVCDAVNDDCIEVTRKLVEEGYRPIMLNMANRHTPGGGVINGARAQEESIFRQSNLCISLYQFDEYHAGLLDLPLGNGRYPMDRNTGGIYSGRVTFFRTGARNGDALVETPFECAVVSVAAINRPDLTGDGRLIDWAVKATKSKIRTMLRIGLLHGHDAIVLGAWGCGAFRNPPEHMAQLFHEVLREAEFAEKYSIVRFAVIEDHNSRHSNFAPFNREFNHQPPTTNHQPLTTNHYEQKQSKGNVVGTDRRRRLRKPHSVQRQGFAPVDHGDGTVPDIPASARLLDGRRLDGDVHHGFVRAQGPVRPEGHRRDVR